MHFWVSTLDTNNNRTFLKCVAIPTFFHTDPFAIELFIESREERIYFLLKQVHGLYYRLSCHNSFHFDRDLKSLAAEFLLRRW